MRVSGNPPQRRISASKSGRYVVIRQSDGLDVVDALGTAPRVRLRIPDVLDFVCVGPFLWVVTEERLRRFALDGAEEVLPEVELPVDHGRLYPTSSGNAHSALWLGYRRLLIQDIDGQVAVEDITDEAGASAFVGLLGGRRLLIVEDQMLRVRDAGRSSDIARAQLPGAGQVVACSSLFRGQALAVLVEAEAGDAFLVMRPNGALVHRIALPRTRLCALAEIGGVALVHDVAGNRLLALDLRYGRVRARVEAPLAMEDLAIDVEARYVTIAGFPAEEPEGTGPSAGDPEHELAALEERPQPGDEPSDNDDAEGEDDEDEDATGSRGNGAGHGEEPELSVLHLPYTDLFGNQAAQRRRLEEPAHPAESPDRADHANREDGGKSNGANGAGRPLRDELLAGDPARDHASSLAVLGAELRVDAAAGAAAMPALEEPPPPPEPIVIPEGPLLGLGTVLGPAQVEAIEGDWYLPYPSPEDHLEDLLDLATARVNHAIARAWDSGRLSQGSEDALPFQREVQALVGEGGGYAAELLERAAANLAEVSARCGGRTNASVAARKALPFIEIGREFDLGFFEGQVLMLAAAPMLRGELARLYGILANDDDRPVCDRHVLELIVGGDHAEGRQKVARVLSPDSTLVKYGLLRIHDRSGEDSLFAHIVVDPVLIARLQGDRFGGAGPTDTTSILWASRKLEDLRVPDSIKRDLVLGLAKPPRDGRPYRVLLRGRRGSGRRTLAAALAARVDKPLAVIECERLPRGGLRFVEALKDELLRAGLRGAVACVSGLEVFDSTDAEGLEHIRAVFRTHPAAVIIRTTPEFRAPLDPGYLSFTLPPLSESERYEFWEEALALRGLQAAGIERLASRFRIGPGTIESVISAATARMELEDRATTDATELLETTARQHIETRMSNVASHVTRLPAWEQVALPDEMLDSIREFIGRVLHRRTVYESWGFDRKVSTSRGLTALFYGPPGTGKTMVAGLIARELSLDLYRVDLARITSKWIGETEKNLAEIFDAAEDGQAIILFDEADSLFAKRTSEVKSSVDRYANLEVNYLLQRLDSFEGVAILTTNLEGAIDKAFKRRMSLRLAFPFPDEEMRVRLWAAHIPPEVPTAGDFDFMDLARRFPMSGGYIRNSALRAAFLAAQENVPMTHKHLERAIHLEYREMGKLAPGGRME